MEWMETKIYTTHQGVEPLTGVLLECGVEGIQIDDDEDLKSFLENNYLDWDYVDEELSNKKFGDTIITMYLSKNPYGIEMLNNIKNSIDNLKNKNYGIDFGKLEIKCTDVDDEDWSNNWKKYYKPFRIGKSIIVKPIWEDYNGNAGDVIFTINPGSAFGTGLHQTTQLCIEALEKLQTNNKKVLDLGCGSGILSIISLLLGAKKALAVDIDKNAVDNALENGKINNVENFEGLYGDILNNTELVMKINEDKYDIVVANIVADVIMSISLSAKKFLKANGIFITSGIIKQRLPEVLTNLEEVGFKIMEINERDEWCSVVAINYEEVEK